MVSRAQKRNAFNVSSTVRRTQTKFRDQSLRSHLQGSPSCARVKISNILWSVNKQPPKIISWTERSNHFGRTLSCIWQRIDIYLVHPRAQVSIWCTEYCVSGNYVSVKSKLQHPPTRAYPGHLTPLPSRRGGNLIIRVFHGVGNLNCTLDFMWNLWRGELSTVPPYLHFLKLSCLLLLF